MKKKEGLFNFRLPSFVFLALSAGGALGYAYFFFAFDKIYFLAVVPVTAAIFIGLILKGCTKRRLIMLFLSTAAFVAGVALSCAAFSAYGKGKSGGAEVSGRVTERLEGDGYDRVVLSDVYADGEKLDGKLLVYVYDGAGDYFERGYTVSFTASVNKYDLFVYGNVNYRACDGIKYYCYVKSGLTAKYGFSLFGVIDSSIKNALYSNLPDDTAQVAYSMLTGNTSAMDEGTVSAFRYGGIAHIFAVSGLHIGLVYASVTAFFKKVRLNKYAAAALSIAAILFYSGVCGFTPSSVRACVMCAVSALSGLVYRKYDSLNSLSVAGVILFLINPFCLFDVGFIMSFSAVYGIILLSPFFNRLFKRLPRPVKSAMSVSLSAQIATFPVMLLTFGYVSWAGLFLNLLVIPFLSIEYMLIFASVIIIAIIPPLGVVVRYACLPLQAFMSFAVGAGFENAVVSGIGGWFIAVAVGVIVALLTDKINFKPLFRMAAGMLSAAALCFYCILSVFVPIGVVRIIVTAYYGGGAVIVRNFDGTTLIVTQDYDSSRLFKTLSMGGVQKVDAVVVLGGELSLQAYINLGINCADTYIYQHYIQMDYPCTDVHYAASFSKFGVEYEYCDGYNLKIVADGREICICTRSVIPYGNCDLLISVFQNLTCDCRETVYFNLNGMGMNIYEYGDLQFAVNNGKLIKIGAAHFAARR